MEFLLTATSFSVALAPGEAKQNRPARADAMGHTRRRMTRGTKARSLTTAALVALLAAGCSTPVASSLDEPEANRVMLALDRAHVAATKELDPAGEGKFRVVVGEEEAARALSALRAEDLPRTRSTSADPAKGALVPSPSAEQAQLAMATAAELERSLEGVDGVLTARVHLNLPAAELLHDGPRAKSTASVLISHRGTTPPLTDAAVQRLVAGGVNGLATTDVAVVMVGRSPMAPDESGGVARLGPFGVARQSLRPIQLTLAVLLVALAGLAATVAVLGTRLARARAGAPEGARMPAR